VPETPVSLSVGSSGPVEVDRDKLDQTLDAIRPALQADGGDLELVEVTSEGVVRVSLVGACGTCPISTTTLKAGVERILKDRVPGVTSVVDVNDAESVLG
jgi:Fe-S cluster biogenesis protein NfuA